VIYKPKFVENQTLLTF